MVQIFWILWFFAANLVLPFAEPKTENHAKLKKRSILYFLLSVCRCGWRWYQGGGNEQLFTNLTKNISCTFKRLISYGKKSTLVFASINTLSLCTEVSFTLPELMWMLIMKLPYTKKKFYPEVKSQTSLSSLRTSCKRRELKPVWNLKLLWEVVPLHGNFTTANLEISNPFQKLFRGLD